MKGRILVVDDERSIREVLTQILEYEGFEVASAGSGGEALTMHHGNPFDLVLLDVKMQGIDGIDTLQQLRRQDPDVRVIMISGHGTIADAVEATRAGAWDFLEKPLSREKVLLALKNALEQSSLRVENDRLRELAGAGPRMVNELAAVAGSLTD